MQHEANFSNISYNPFQISRRLVLCKDGFHGAWLHFQRARVGIYTCLVQLCTKYRLVSANSAERQQKLLISR